MALEALALPAAEAPDVALDLARVDLAAGEAPGQGGSFAERFRVVSGEASGELVVMELRPRADREFLFSDITSGPVLFATC